MDPNHLIPGFAGLAILAACWRQVLAFMQRLRSIFLLRVTLQGDAAQSLSRYCYATYKRWPVGDRLYRSANAFVRPLKRMQEIAYERPPIGAVVLFDGWRPIMLEGSQCHKDAAMPDDGLVTITVVRFLTDADQLLIDALQMHNDKQGKRNGHSRYFVRRVGGRRKMDYSGNNTAPQALGSPGVWHPDQNERFLKWTREDIGPPISDDPMGALVFPEEFIKHIEEFERWIASEEWFRSRMVPWRRGWLLHGMPGTGKTSLVRALAQKYDLPVFSFDLSTLSNEEMISGWRDAQEHAPCITLFEDVDSVFVGRENVTGEMGGGLTFDCLLNCMSGVETADGVFIIATTNHIDKLDDALKRPGRLDNIIEVPRLHPGCLRVIAERILKDWPDEIDKVVHSGECVTGAQMTERCVRVALERYWNESD